MSSSSTTATNGGKVGVDKDDDNNDSKYKKVSEGSSVMVYPADQESAVFYNPVQVQNRDLSTLMITLYAERDAKRKAVKEKRKELRAQMLKGDDLKKALEEYEATIQGRELVNDGGEGRTGGGIHILDALAASGLRSMRYWKEIPGVDHVTINDLDDAAVDRAHDNVRENELTDVSVKDRSKGIRIHHGDATHLLYNSRPTLAANNSGNEKPWDVIDLDPYGSAAPFLDGAVQAVKDGGMLNVTCTDMAALGGSHPETCYGRYGSMPIQRSKYLQEFALRILLYSLANTAAKYGKVIQPVLSVGMNFYIRCFVEVSTSKAAVNDLSLKVGSVYQSTQCPSFFTIPHGQYGKKNKNVWSPTRIPLAQCEETGAPFKVGGPLWLGPLHDLQIVQEALDRLPSTKLLTTKDRLQGLLFSVQQELPDVPLYYTLPDLGHTLHCTTPPLDTIKAAIVNAGYRVSGYHKEPQAIKTDAPNRIVWDIMRAWCKKNPTTKSKKKQKKKNKKARKKDADEDEKDTDDSDDPISSGDKILAVEPSIEVDFTVRRLLPKSDVPRFPMNPEKHWGPKPRASGKRKRGNERNDSNQIIVGEDSAKN